MPDNQQNDSQTQGFFAEFLSLPNDSTKKTLFVAILLCLVCSIVVSTSAVMLKPLQVANKKVDKRANILAVVDLLGEKADIDKVFDQIETKIVDLETGEYADIDVETFDQVKAASDPATSISLTKEQDIAGIGYRSKYANVYLLKENDEIKKIILPVHGYGLWSTLYGFLALESDAKSIYGLKFYQHAETPGLGGEIDNPKWRSVWKGKTAFNADNELVIKVARGKVNPNESGAESQVDGLSGATLTGQGVSNLVNYWLGEHGFGPYLKQFHNKG